MKCIVCNKNEPNKESGLCGSCEQWEAGKINGILYLPALGLAFGIIFGGVEIYNFIIAVLFYFYEVGFISYYSLGGITFLILAFIISLYAAHLFFRHKKGTRRAMIIYYVAGLIVTLYFTILPAILFSIPLGSESIRPLFAGVFGIVIWVPYFLFSKRINRVFYR